MFAVIACQGSQYIVRPEEIISVKKMPQKEGEMISFDKVLLFQAEKAEAPMIGTPYLENVVVEAEVKKQYKGKKIRVFKYKAKKRYARTMGQRDFLTDLKISKMELQNFKKAASDSIETNEVKELPAAEIKTAKETTAKKKTARVKKLNEE